MLHTDLTPLEGKGFPPQGNPTGQSSSQKISDNNRSLTGCENRQYLGSSPHNLPGWDEITKLSPGGSGSADMDMATAVLTESNPHPGGDKQSSGHFVTHRGSSPNLSPIRDSSGRYFCLQGDDPLPGMVLPYSTRKHLRSGCHKSGRQAYYMLFPPLL